MAQSDDIRQYDGLFLISPHAMGGDLAGAIEHVQGMLDRAGAETLSLRKWHEMQLAYPIQGQNRGVYLLALFRVGPKQIANIQRDCNLSELVMRELILSADHFGESEIEAEAAESRKSPEEQAAEAEAESDAGPTGKPEEAESLAETPTNPAGTAGAPAPEAAGAERKPEPVGQSS